MTLYSKVKELRDKLLGNCEYAIYLHKTAKKRVTSYSTQNQEGTSTDSGSSNDPQDISTSTKGTESDTAYEIEITDKSIMNSFMELTHGVLIQEWEHFLYDVFVEGVIYYLRGYDLGDPKYKLRLKYLRSTIEIAEMRENISGDVKESLWGYENLFSESRKLFKVEVPELLQEMKKHVQIRHIFQHNKGKIRKKDLSKIGSDGPDACFYILDDEGKLEPYKEGQKILLSLPEIQKLYTVIEAYSEAFQKQAEKAKPVKAG